MCWVYKRIQLQQCKNYTVFGLKMLMDEKAVQRKISENKSENQTPKALQTYINYMWAKEIHNILE